MNDATAIDFLVRAAREFRRGGWVFTGFHWPVLAGQVAHALDGAPFSQVFEAGVATWAAGDEVPTSTTDYAAYANAYSWLGDSAAVLLAGGRHFTRVVLDASNVDIRGRVNSSFIGESRDNPKVRLPGGGGAPDIAASARELVLLTGATDLRRFQRAVEHVTAAPGPDTLVRLHTRWGIVRLGEDLHVEEVAENSGTAAFLEHVSRLGADLSRATPRAVVSEEERHVAETVLESAARRGYQVAARALKNEGDEK